MIAEKRLSCTRGHPYTLENTAFLLKDRRRVCTICVDLCHCSKGHLLMGDNLIFRKAPRVGDVQCRECKKIYLRNRKLKRKNLFSTDDLKKESREGNLKHFYGMSLEDYDNLLKKQNYKCSNPFCNVIHSDSKKLHVDHDHACCPAGKKSCGKCIRGLLCSNCNLLLGMSGDNENYLNGLIGYLQLWKKSTQGCSLGENQTIAMLEENLVGVG